MRPRLIAVDDPMSRSAFTAESSASMRPRLIAVDDVPAVVTTALGDALQ